MSSGELRDLMAFEEPSASAADGGVVSGAWSERFRRLVAIENARGNETVDSRRLQGVNPVMITVRSSSQTRTVTSAWRLRHVLTSEYYNVRSVIPHPDREWINLFCETGVAVNG